MIFKWLAERRRRKEEEHRQQLFGAPVYVADKSNPFDDPRAAPASFADLHPDNRLANQTDSPFLDFKRRYPSPFEDDNERD